MHLYKKIKLAALKRENKYINTSTYTAVPLDRTVHLVFNVPCVFTIPANMFDDGDEIQGEAMQNFVDVVGGSGMTINVVISQKPKVAQYALFGINFKSATSSVLYGQLIAI